MVARTLEDLVVYQKALLGANAVSALIQRSALCKDFQLRSQLADASAAVPAHIAEGFGQQTDRHFAQYLGIARGSSQEVRAHLAVACGRGHISTTECAETSRIYEEVARMLTALIRHLRISDRKQRA